jgi:hypothetical protein
MGVVADLMVKVGADIGSFKSGMGTVSKDVDSAGGGFAKFGGLAMGAGLLAAGAVTGIAAFGMAAVQHAQEAGQAAYDMSEKFGLLPGRASEWLSVGHQVGLTNEQVTGAFQKLSKSSEAMSLSLLATGKISKTAAEPYKLLGINVLDAAGHVKSADQLMLESANAFAKMKDGPEKAALAMKLFGKSGTDMLPILNLGAAGIEKYMQKGKAMGDAMSGAQVLAAHKLMLEHKQLDTAVSGLTTRIGSFLMPIMVSLMGFVLNTAIPALQQFETFFIKHIWPAIMQVWSAFMTLLAPALKYIKAHFDDLKPVLLAVGIVVGIVLGAIVIGIALVVLAVVGLVAGIAWLVSNFRSGFPAALGHIQDFVVGGIKNFLRFKSWLTALPGDLAKGAQAVGTGIVNGIINGIVALKNMVLTAIKNLLPGGANGPVVLAMHAAGIPGFQFGGVVPGAYSGQARLIVAHAGETVTPQGQSGPGSGITRVTTVNVIIQGGIFMDHGPTIDLLVNKITQRVRLATGV